MLLTTQEVFNSSQYDNFCYLAGVLFVALIHSCPMKIEVRFLLKFSLMLLIFSSQVRADQCSDLLANDVFRFLSSLRSANEMHVLFSKLQPLASKQIEISKLRDEKKDLNLEEESWVLSHRLQVGLSFIEGITQVHDSLQAFFQVVTEVNPQSMQLLRVPMRKLEDFKKKIPSNIEDWVLRTENQFYNGKPVSPTKVYAQYVDLLKTWTAMLNSRESAQQGHGFYLPDLIRSLKAQNPSLFENRKVAAYWAKALELGLELNLRTSMLYRNVAKDGITSTFNLNSYFSYELPSRHGIHVNFSPPADPFKISTDPSLFLEMIVELHSNAMRATVRRKKDHEADGVHLRDLPEVRIENRMGRVVISLIDAGDPNDYIAYTGFGYSKTGFGIGRYKIAVIAHYLGIQLQHRVRPDGLGSIIELILPE